MTSSAASFLPGNAQAGSVAAAARLKPGRVLLLSTNLGIGGGAEEQVQQLALELHNRGWAVQVISMLRPGSLPPEFRDSGVETCSLNMWRGVPDPTAILRLARMVRRFRPDILHSHMTHANLLARAARPLTSVPALICTLHGSKMYSVRGGSTRLRELAHRFTDRWADLTTAICQAAADICIEDGAAPADKVRVMHNGVDTGRFRPRQDVRNRVRAELAVEDKFVWLAVGRFELPKNYPLMLRAFARTRQHKAGESVLLVCGSGSMQGHIEAMARELASGLEVRFLGVRRDIQDVMNAADAFVLSSDTEGLPMVLLQASASALPIVATDVGGNREVVQHNRTGFLVPPGDDRALADAILRTMSLSGPERARLGAAGRNFTEDQFGIGHVVDQWEQLYHSFTGRKKTL